jgi:hypothetical protein
MSLFFSLLKHFFVLCLVRFSMNSISNEAVAVLSITFVAKDFLFVQSLVRS